MDRIREIEQEIDNFHKSAAIFSVNRSQALFDVLRIFEDTCRFAALQSLILPAEEVEGFSRAQMDGLKTAIKWIYDECPYTSDGITFKFDHNDYLTLGFFMLNNAIPYSQICDGYVGYSRGLFDARVEENKVEFLLRDDRGKVILFDIAEVLEKKQSVSLSASILSQDIISDFVKSITIENDGKISYSAEPEIIDYFLNVGEQHWNASSSFPEDWFFDGFTMQEYKATWKSLFAMAALHQLACLRSGIDGCAVENIVIVQEKEQLISALSEISHVAAGSAKNIVQLIIYDPGIKNTDIMYQPLVQVGSNILIAPTLDNM